MKTSVAEAATETVLTHDERLRQRAEDRWARIAANVSRMLESNGTVSVPAYYGGDMGDHKHITRLHARCPFCKKLNNDEHIALYYNYTLVLRTTMPEGACKHFVKLQGGCGAYDFVFRRL